MPGTSVYTDGSNDFDVHQHIDIGDTVGFAGSVGTKPTVAHASKVVISGVLTAVAHNDVIVVNKTTGVAQVISAATLAATYKFKK